MPIMNEFLDRSSSFAYSCNGCGRCCRCFRIQVNPYEVLRLARHLGVSTADFTSRYLEDGPYLRRREDGVCVFLGDKLCGVHPARPLVCRLYPLVRHVSAQDEEGFSILAQVPGGEGRFEGGGAVQDFLDQQGAEAYMAAADGYLRLFRRMDSGLARVQGTADSEAVGGPAEEAGGAGGVNDLLDPDSMVARHCAAMGVTVPDDPEAMAAIHIEAIGKWLDAFLEERET